MLSDLLEGCSNKSGTVMIYNNIVTTLCRQPCNILVTTGNKQYVEFPRFWLIVDTLSDVIDIR